MFLGIQRNSNYVLNNKPTRHIATTARCLHRRDDSGDRITTGKGDKRRGTGGDKGGNTTQEVKCPKCGSPTTMVDTFVGKHRHQKFRNFLPKDLLSC